MSYAGTGVWGRERQQRETRKPDRFIVSIFDSLSEIRLEEVHRGLSLRKRGKVIPRRGTDVGKGAGTDSE